MKIPFYAGVISQELEKLLHEVEQNYPGTEIGSGTIAIPDFIATDKFLHAIVERAINNTGLQNGKFFNIVRSSYVTVTATTIDDDNIIDIFDALVITNTSDWLSASWYQMRLRHYFLGTFVDPKLNFSMLKTYSEASKPLSFQTAPNWSGLRTFVKSGEELYSKKIGVGRRLMTGHSRLILRINNTESVFEEMSDVLRGTRFDPARITTSVYRDEEDDWLWSAALQAAEDTKYAIDKRYRFDATRAFGCIEHEICMQLRDCVIREARGELVICEDPIVPEPTFLEKVEEAARDGRASWYKTIIWPGIYQIGILIEGRIWYRYCKNGMPLAGETLKAWCEDYMIDEGLVTGLDTSSKLLDSVILYWLGNTSEALFRMSMHWFGLQEFFLFWVLALKKVLGKEVFSELFDGVNDYLAEIPGLEELVK
ncbi:hypothetical protein K469DRAFT_705093 [Zopfia rhizophila CBS 207.26]|uniref:Uncharacterized protein n=1 Tax=Zopfia rhizophila CBS 207.26 TaxID=1314779 RepID=A0A6A6E9D4_9PEZI|nr:hypothetical protein K469DRAFT_705093 [Zopfia rhizophila CBS 207.26]